MIVQEQVVSFISFILYYITHEQKRVFEVENSSHLFWRKGTQGSSRMENALDARRRCPVP